MPEAAEPPPNTRPSPPPIDEGILRAPTPPPMLPRRGVPMPMRPLHLEPVTLGASASLPGTALENYVRNTEEAPGEPVKILRDLPFGDAFAPSDTPFFLDDANTTPIEIDDADTDGIPIGLPDLIGFSDVPFTPAAPVAAPEERGPPSPSKPAYLPMAVMFLFGILLGAGIVLLVR